MNEVIAILYYCFWKFGNEAVISTHYLESDLFFCFSNLMAELKDGFLRELDREDSGLQGKCKAIDDIVAVCDPEVAGKLIDESVVTQFYALRWIMLLMCQDFEMPNCVRLWDTLLADQNRFDFLNYVSASVIIQVRDIILEGDFAVIMETLQAETKNVGDVSDLLQTAWELKITYQQRLAE
jgi:TBC1 domain family member 13